MVLLLEIEITYIHIHIFEIIEITYTYILIKNVNSCNDTVPKDAFAHTLSMVQARSGFL